MSFIEDFIDWIMGIFPRIWQFLVRAVKAIIGKINGLIPSFGPMIDNMIKTYLEFMSLNHPELGDTMKKLYVSVKRKAKLWFFDEEVEVTVLADGQHAGNIQASVKTIPFKDLPRSMIEDIKREKMVEVSEIIR